mgnify:CR=1 FL=1
MISSLRVLPEDYRCLLRVCTVQVWLLLAGTTIGVGLLVGLMEWANETYKKAGGA